MKNLGRMTPWIAGGVVTIVLSFTVSRHSLRPLSGEKGQPDIVLQRGIELRKELESTYDDLRSRGLLTRDNDVKTIVIKYIPIGTSFDDAERILRAAGCKVGSEPDVATLPADEQLRLGHIDASLGLSHGWSDSGRLFFVSLYPRTPTEYDLVARLDASIIRQNF
jgi:hypothetical protein